MVILCLMTIFRNLKRLVIGFFKVADNELGYAQCGFTSDELSKYNETWTKK